jgi:nucleotide-binding universal stress UspA family protein
MKSNGVRMNMKSILLPVDGSPYSMTAARIAADLSRLTGAEIVLLHCYLGLPLTREIRVYGKVMEELVELSNALLEPYRALLSESEVPFSEELLEGNPAEMIVEVAARRGSDLIVMGSKGHSQLEGIFLGSVTHKVLHTAPCHVLVTRGAPNPE